jgi:hypothetical protein
MTIVVQDHLFSRSILLLRYNRIKVEGIPRPLLDSDYS